MMISFKYHAAGKTRSKIEQLSLSFCLIIKFSPRDSIEGWR